MRRWFAFQISNRFLNCVSGLALTRNRSTTMCTPPGKRRPASFANDATDDTNRGRLCNGKSPRRVVHTWIHAGESPPLRNMTLPRSFRTPMTNTTRTEQTRTGSTDDDSDRRYCDSMAEPDFFDARPPNHSLDDGYRSWHQFPFMLPFKSLIYTFGPAVGNSLLILDESSDHGLGQRYEDILMQSPSLSPRRYCSENSPTFQTT
jgi:hypothetical protein